MNKRWDAKLTWGTWWSFRGRRVDAGAPASPAPPVSIFWPQSRFLQEYTCTALTIHLFIHPLYLCMYYSFIHSVTFMRLIFILLFVIFLHLLFIHSLHLVIQYSLIHSSICVQYLFIHSLHLSVHYSFIHSIKLCVQYSLIYFLHNIYASNIHSFIR